MKNNKYISHILLWGLLTLVLIGWGARETTVFAEEVGTSVTFAAPEQVDGVILRRLTLWQMPSDELPAPGEEAMRAFLARFDGRTAEEITQMLGRTPTTLAGQVEADFVMQTTLPDGSYFGVDVLEAAGEQMYRAYLLFTVPDEVYLPLKSKFQREEKPGTGVLEKVDASGTPLSGVGFTLFFSADHPLNDTGELKPVPLSSSLAYEEGGEVRELLTDASGHITVTGLPPGGYVFRETHPLPGYYVEQPDHVLEIREQETTTLRVVNTKNSGGFRFLKVSADGNDPLSGARFLLTQKAGEIYTRVQAKGEDVVLNSGTNGRFEISGLPYGTYYLWEVESPEGYEKLAQPVTFTVGDQMSQTVLMIEDTPVNQPNLPNTGDILFLLLSGAGAVLMLIGALLLRDGKDPRQSKVQEA